jgi:hypothetical protein
MVQTVIGAIGYKQKYRKLWQLPVNGLKNAYLRFL